MDSITLLAESIHVPLLSQLNLILDNSVILGVIVLVLIFIGENRNEKRMKIILSMVTAAVIAMAIKNVMMMPRPCAGNLACPDDYSFPSLHATIAFTLMAGFLNKKIYLWYWLFALFVSFSRLNLGVHTFIDIAGALPVALLSYYAVGICWDQFVEGKKDEKRN